MACRIICKTLLRLNFFPYSSMLYLLCSTSLRHLPRSFFCGCMSRLHWCRHILQSWRPGSVTDLHNQFQSQNDSPWWGTCRGLAEKGSHLLPNKLEHCHIPVTVGMWPHHWCSACSSALDWATQTASFRASLFGSFSCCSKAAEASVAHPSCALLFPSALSDAGQWGMSGQWAVLVGSDGRIQSLLSFQCASGHCLSGEGLSEELYSGNYLEEPSLTLQTCSSLSAAREDVSAHTSQGVWNACLCLQWWACDAWKELIPPQPLNHGWNVGILNLKANIWAPFTVSVSSVWCKLVAKSFSIRSVVMQVPAEGRNIFF